MGSSLLIDAYCQAVVQQGLAKLTSNNIMYEWSRGQLTLQKVPKELTGPPTSYTYAYPQTLILF
jgi:hypothetical protein